jgi:3-hydroxybutyrate dehydrogenase
MCPAYVRTAVVERQIPRLAGLHTVDEEMVIKRLMLCATVNGESGTATGIAEDATVLEAFPCSAMSGQALVVSRGWHMT